jgi:hypothetical protein
LQLLLWSEAKGRTKDLLLAAVREVPGNARLREAVVAVLGDAALFGGPVEQPRVQGGVEAKVFEPHEIVLVLKEQSQRILDEAHMPAGPVRPGDSFSIREGERPAVKTFLACFRQLPAEEQKRLPALLNNLGKLLVVGHFRLAGRV